MKKRHFYFLGSSILIFVLVQLFIYASELKSNDELHQQHFNMKYGIFAIVQPEELNFAGEEIPIQSPEIWERLDKELLKNTYWQSNTMLFFKKANKYFPIIEPILKKNNIPNDFNISMSLLVHSNERLHFCNYGNHEVPHHLVLPLSE